MMKKRGFYMVLLDDIGVFGEIHIESPMFCPYAANFQAFVAWTK